MMNCENVKIAQFNDFLKINFAIKYVIIHRKRDFLLKHACEIFITRERMCDLKYLNLILYQT